MKAASVSEIVIPAQQPTRYHVQYEDIRIVSTTVRSSDQVFITLKVKWSRYRPSVAQRLGRGIALLFHDCGTRRGEWSAARPARTLSSWKTRYPFYRRLGGPQGRSGRAENLVPTEIQSRTVQSVVSRYTDWATRPMFITLTAPKLFVWKWEKQGWSAVKIRLFVLFFMFCWP